MPVRLLAAAACVVGALVLFGLLFVVASGDTPLLAVPVIAGSVGLCFAALRLVEADRRTR